LTRRILIVSGDRVGRQMAGPGIRCWGTARHLSGQFDVTLSAPDECDLEPDGFRVVIAHPDHHPSVWPLVRQSDAVVAQFLPVQTMLRAAQSDVRTIYDLYDPIHLENFALDGSATRTARRELNVRATELLLELALLTGDSFVCASERQRDLWLGALGALGRLDREQHLRDPSFRSLIDVVPFGLQRDPPRRIGQALKGVDDRISASDRVVLWAGGIWDWLDPLTPIRAVARLAETREDVRLVFLGGRHPNPNFTDMDMRTHAMRLAEELGVRDRSVIFNEGWVPYEERAAHLLDADIGVSGHFDTLEARFSFRTRMLDYIWAGLPVVGTGGDDMTESIARSGGGMTVGYEDVEGWTSALQALLEPDANQEARRKIGSLRSTFEWATVVEPLADLASRPASPKGVKTRTRLRAAEYAAVRLRLSQQHRGTFGAAARVLEHARRRPI
jgi:glycosyltransferase involved in cell wall biosynthesis